MRSSRCRTNSPRSRMRCRPWPRAGWSSSSTTRSARTRGTSSRRPRRSRPRSIEFMITHGRGQLCMPIMPELAERLATAPDGRARTRRRTGRRSPVPVDHKSCRTGISAEERARTVRRDRRPGDQAGRPGPARAPVPAGGQGRGRAPPRRAHRGDGRPGPAGRPDAGRACSARSSTASGMASRERLHAIAAEFGLPILSIEMLIRYRRRREKLVHRVAEAELPTRYGHGPDHRLRRQARAGQQPDRLRDGRPAARSRPRWSGSTRRASPATCSNRSAATAATSSTWPWR